MPHPMCIAANASGRPSASRSGAVRAARAGSTATATPYTPSAAPAGRRQALGLPAAGASGPRGVAALKPTDAIGEIRLRKEAVSVHPRHELPAGVGEREIEAVRRATARVIEHAHARVACRKPLEPSSRVVARATLGEQE